MRISKDLREFIEVLNAKGVEYLVVGRTPLLSRAQRAPREGVHHGPKGQSELRSLGQDKAYPTKPPAFWMWGKLQLAQPGDSRRQPGLGLWANKGDEARPARFFNRAVPFARFSSVPL